MRVIVMFDLPVATSKNRRDYRYFRKFLISEGFVMMQESIYTKICINQHAVDKAMINVRRNCPAHGLVQVLSVTERQFASMKVMVGDIQNIYVQSEERMVVL